MATAGSRVSTRWMGTRCPARAGCSSNPASNAWIAKAAARTNPSPVTGSASTEVQEHDDRVLLILGVVLRPHAHGAEGEAAVEAKGDGIRAADLERDVSADLAPGEVDHVGQHARGVTRAPRLGVGRDVEDVHLVGDEPVVPEGDERPGQGVADDVDVGEVAGDLLQEHLARPGRLEGKAL